MWMLRFFPMPPVRISLVTLYVITSCCSLHTCTIPRSSLAPKLPHESHLQGDDRDKHLRSFQRRNLFQVNLCRNLKFDVEVLSGCRHQWSRAHWRYWIRPILVTYNTKFVYFEYIVVRDSFISSFSQNHDRRCTSGSCGIMNHARLLTVVDDDFLIKDRIPCHAAKCYDF